LKEKRILIAEDDPDHAELISDVLKEDNTKEIKTEVTLKKDGQKAYKNGANGYFVKPASYTRILPHVSCFLSLFSILFSLPTTYCVLPIASVFLFSLSPLPLLNNNCTIYATF
jgi:hypothetical protein